ncbi:hypothetical protein FRB91_000590 [Serendipita sp. 411]|nr:hypothetical protein FRB91_000590 [Serendipita sp. 411]KAG9055686.1 hypothetical protein FS842_001493 [Serendipita sp. 407]
MAVLGKVKEQPEPWIKFRNQQEARQFIRVLPALRESYFADTEEKEVERCGRDCRTCEEKIAHTIQEPLVDATPEVVLVITDETEEEKNGESISPINIVPRNEVHSYFSDLYMYTEEMQSLL